MNRQPTSAFWVLTLLGLAVLIPMASLLAVGRLPGFEPGDLQFWHSSYIRRVLFFSFWQAFLSTLISLGLALLVARSIAFRGNFPLRNLLLKLFGLPLVVPSIVAVMGVVSVYGAEGWIPLGRSLYGLNGILIAHVFFNLPLAVRLLLPVWQSLPDHYWQLAEQLRFTPWQRWVHIEWPAIRENLPGVSLLVFMLCLTSFAVVLTLGGGPKSSTLEVAIYQSLRFDFDPTQAVILALLQLSLCLVVAVIGLSLQKLPEVEITISASNYAWHNKNRLFHNLVILLAAIFVGLPLLAMILDAIRGPVIEVISDNKLWQATAYTLMIGLSAAFCSVLAGWFLLRSSSVFANRGQINKAKWIELAGSVVYVVPPLVLGTGYFVLLAPHVDVFDWVFPIVILINAMMGLPFVIKVLSPAMRKNQMRYQNLCCSLALQGWHKFRWIDWPLLRRPIGLAAALVSAMAMGDLGVIALFGSVDTTTLPLMLYQQLGAYRIPQAAVSAVFLLLMCLLVFWSLERGLGGKDYVKN
ncbi:MAG: thiamine/thiamine pyrophosphate ABC transporter, permease protein [Gammaproteobacteria bacterium]|jgi:thiamine transport system permease protein|nr:thiamine/thiamine pyrophosphate ABC transporter, permease protein [Gammaproteobacteria bacterium]MBT3725941.1 thiamine/thiamine pyrophosphate ABC transporter, permease protein [Gammaproteobacteria bacterium]MBT4195880.1 thiamine/thiamine pyrophosphate ABC transporter, permease protein [Gammaproteobacteria bacterium]MBT4448988.1 thiamine/thiamine pyrophosphate ABC transporter, permease protein [Gammaproteobacteria bacterium]MBT4861650.1 thiamine/thiamine pyrophosphate ABC transporter, permeas